MPASGMIVSVRALRCQVACHGGSVDFDRPPTWRRRRLAEFGDDAARSQDARASASDYRGGRYHAQEPRTRGAEIHVTALSGARR